MYFWDENPPLRTCTIVAGDCIAVENNGEICAKNVQGTMSILFAPAPGVEPGPSQETIPAMFFPLNYVGDVPGDSTAAGTFQQQKTRMRISNHLVGFLRIDGLSWFSPRRVNSVTFSPEPGIAPGKNALHKRLKKKSMLPFSGFGELPIVACAAIGACHKHGDLITDTLDHLAVTLTANFPLFANHYANLVSNLVFHKTSIFGLEPDAGIEPATCCLQGSHSTY